MALDKDLLDKLIEGYQKPEDLIGENGLLKQLTKALVERALNAELTHHLGYENNNAEGRGSGNLRNGYAVASTLYAVPFDSKRLQIGAGSVPDLEGVRRSAG